MKIKQGIVRQYCLPNKERQRGTITVLLVLLFSLISAIVTINYSQSGITSKKVVVANLRSTQNIEASLGGIEFVIADIGTNPGSYFAANGQPLAVLPATTVAPSANDPSAAGFQATVTNQGPDLTAPGTFIFRIQSTGCSDGGCASDNQKTTTEDIRVAGGAATPNLPARLIVAEQNYTGGAKDKTINGTVTVDPNDGNVDEVGILQNHTGEFEGHLHGAMDVKKTREDPTLSTKTDEELLQMYFGPNATIDIIKKGSTVLTGSAPSCPVYSAGTSYAEGVTVTNAGASYTCKVASWCSSASAAHYAPGTGTAWKSAWKEAKASVCTTKLVSFDDVKAVWEAQVTGSKGADYKTKPIWVEGDWDLGKASREIGTPSNPAVIIVNGDCRGNAGSISIYGYLLCLGEYDGGGGSLTLTGAVLVGGHLTDSGAIRVQNLAAVDLLLQQILGNAITAGGGGGVAGTVTRLNRWIDQ